MKNQLRKARFISGLLLCLAVLSAAFVVLQQPQGAAAQAAQPVISNNSTEKSLSSLLNAVKISAPAVITDTYEQPISGVNNDAPPGVQVGGGQLNLVPCAIPFTLVTNATLAKGNGTADTDWYNFSLTANVVYTLEVRSQGGAPAINFITNLFDPVGTLSTRTGETIVYVFFSSTTGSYRFQLQALNFGAYQPIDQPYNVTLCSSPTNITATPLPSSTPTTTPTPLGVAPDPYEANDSPALVLARNPVVSFINVGATIANLNFYPYTSTIPINATGDLGDQDWFFFYARRSVFVGGSGGTYRVATSIQPGTGVDTEIFLFKDTNCSVPTGNLVLDSASNPLVIARNDDVPGTINRASQIDFNSDSDCVYWAKIINKDPAPRGNAAQSYTFAVSEFLSTPTPTGTPQATSTAATLTPFPQSIDSFEYNGDFTFSTLINPGVKYSNLNFVPFQPTNVDTQDNDFFRLPVKQGIYYTCETLDLAPGVDTNMILYNQDQNPIGGNDDVSALDKEAGKFNSRITWLSGYTGFAFVLVGQVSPPRANEATARTYALQCTIGIPATPTPIGGPPTPTVPPTAFVPPTPLPPDATMTPFPTPRTQTNLPVRKIEPGAVPGRAPQPTPPPTATPRPVALDVQIFNDNNRNGLLDPGEGVSNTSIRILDEGSGVPLGQTNTDNEGRARFTIFNEGAVRVSIPLFGYSTLITENQATVRIALVPMEVLPAKLP